MPPFPRPKFSYSYWVDAQLEALRRYRDEQPGRAVPVKAPDRILLATWNLANLGVQERRNQDYRLIAEILSWFDVIGVQEVNDDLSGIRALLAHLPDSYRLMFSDASGNNERLTFVYDSTKVSLLEEVGEISFPPNEYRYVRLLDVTAWTFEGFDRNPYLSTFRSNSFTFSLVNCHSYFGDDSTKSMARRTLETYAVARWADLRRQSRYAVTSDIIPLGDFNLPKLEEGDPIRDALVSKGLHLPEHSTRIGSSIANDSHYDQVAFFPGETMSEYTGRSGVFDFDGALFRHLWSTRGRSDFLAYLRYYISDHRPLWAEFRT